MHTLLMDLFEGIDLCRWFFRSLTTKRPVILRVCEMLAERDSDGSSYLGNQCDTIMTCYDNVRFQTSLVCLYTSHRKAMDFNLNL